MQNSQNPAVKRLMREARELAADPNPDFSAAPLPSDIMEWHFEVRGPAGTPSSAGRPVRRRSGSWGATAGRC